MLSGLPPFSLWAEVVRQTEDGFAVCFLEMDTEDRQSLGAVLKRVAEGEPR